MLTWTLIVVGAVMLPSAAPQHQKDCAQSQSAPAVSCRPIHAAGQSIQRTSYALNACAATDCACPAAPSCAMPATPASCQPVTCCTTSVAPSCAMPASAACGQAFCGTYGGGMQPAMSQCCHGGNCQCGNGDCRCGCNMSRHKRCRNRRRWCKAHTAGDMYPHFPYYPQDHGTYYFRPYNYTNVPMQQAQVMAMGRDPQNPYTVSMFDSVYENYFAEHPQPIAPPVGTAMPFGSDLPNLEDLLNSGE
jgi:hypothetical protein